MRNRRSARLQRRCPTWRSTDVLWMGLGFDAPWCVRHRRPRCGRGAMAGRAHRRAHSLDCSSSSVSSTAATTLPIAIERGEGLIVGADRWCRTSGVDGRTGSVQGGRARGGVRPARSRISVTRSCSPTTPEPTVTDFVGWNPSSRPPESSARWFGHAPRWSRRAPRRRISCGRSSPSTGLALVWCSRS